MCLVLRAEIVSSGEGKFWYKKRDLRNSVYTGPEYRPKALLESRESSGHLSQMKLPQTDLNPSFPPRQEEGKVPFITTEK